MMAVKQVRASEAGQIAPASGAGNGRQAFSVMDCMSPRRRDTFSQPILNLFLMVFLQVASSACSCMFNSFFGYTNWHVFHFGLRTNAQHEARVFCRPAIRSRYVIMI